MSDLRVRLNNYGFICALHFCIYEIDIYYLLFFRVKKEDIEYKKKIRITGGGQHPANFTEDMVLAASMMRADLEMTGQAEEYGVSPASVVESFPPGNIKLMFLFFIAFCNISSHKVFALFPNLYEHKLYKKNVIWNKLSKLSSLEN